MESPEIPLENISSVAKPSVRDDTSHTKDENQTVNDNPQVEKPVDIHNTIEKIKICKTIFKGKHLHKEIICKKLEKSFLNDNALSIVIQNPKSVESGFFGSNYITYEIITDPFSWHVRRRYSDFEWLRNILAKLFQGHMVPPLPNKKIGSRRFEADFVEKRMQFLQRFLTGICESEYFKSSEALISFLSFSDRSMFEGKMKELNGYTPSDNVEDIKTFEGKVTVVNNEAKEKYFTNISNYFRLQAVLLEGLNKKLKQFHLNIAQVCDDIQEIKKEFETLHLLNSKVSMREEVTNTFEHFKNFFQSWSQILLQQADVAKTNIKDFLKYTKMEGEAYSELIVNRQEAKIKYQSEYYRLDMKKEKLWSQMDPSKWDLNEEENIDRDRLLRDKDFAFKKMCHKETWALEKLQAKLGYANKMNSDELKRMISLLCTRYIQNMKDFVEKYYPSLTEGINTWSVLASFVGGY